MHGGVSGLEKQLPPIDGALAEARDAASALDAVELAVMALEDNPLLNAGYGSVLTIDGTVEMDAAIVDGARNDYGAVTNVQVVHPVSLARRVMERTPHRLLAGAGAMSLGADMPLLQETTLEQRRRWAQALEAGTLEPSRYGAPEHVDTVGAVALDAEGRLAAGSSTGGVFGKMPGRVGDSPVFGAGIYASPIVAVVGTGVGEIFLETLACLRVGLLVEDDGASPQEACERVVTWLGTRRTVSAGLLALDSGGRVGAAFRGGALTIAGVDGPLEPMRLP